jgi:hypothetical protein
VHRHAEKPGHLGQLKGPCVEELSIRVVDLRNVVGLQAAGQHRRDMRIADAAVASVPLAAELLAGLGVQLPVRGQDKAGPRSVAEEPGPVQFARAGQGDRVLAAFDD